MNGERREALEAWRCACELVEETSAQARARAGLEDERETRARYDQAHELAERVFERVRSVGATLIA